jgi:hypothetical protein
VPYCSIKARTPGSPSHSSLRNSAWPSRAVGHLLVCKAFSSYGGSCHFIIFNDHKPINYAFQPKWDKCSPQQFNHLDFIAQFTNDVQHISLQDNVVAGALSCVESVIMPSSCDALAVLQDSDDERQTHLKSSTALWLEKLSVPGTTMSIY